MSPHPDTHLDADDISITSTVEGEPADDAVYAVEEILAEKWDVWDDDDPSQPAFRGIKYLTKWDGYPLHDLLGTWEPVSAFIVPDDGGNNPPGTPPLLRTWYDSKKSMGEPHFYRYCRKNIDDFHAAIETAETARAARKAKRDEKRQRLALTKQRSALFVSDSEDEDGRAASNRPQNQNLPQQATATRKPPLVQSDLSSSEEDLIDDSMMAELGKISKKTTCSSLGTKGSASHGQSRRNSLQSPCSPTKRTAAPVSKEPVAKANQTKQAANKEPQKPSQSLNDAVSQSSEPAAAAPARASDTSVASVERPANSASQGSANKAKRSGAIKVVNQPKMQLRSEWTKGQKAFSTLHFRAVAQKRSRAEGTPDPAALEIVNGPSGSVKPKPPVPHDDPYARREVRQSRTRSIESNDARRGSRSEILTDENVPLAPWEVNKVPQVCAEWRLSNNCPKTAQACIFLHRNKDPDGHDYPVGHAGGLIPPKYRRPPLTCTHWLYGKTGCFKTADKCHFAHRNTGWVPNENHPSENATRIDKNIKPPHNERTHGTLKPVKSMDRLAPRDLTCWYWANDVCRNTAESCQFQHYDTGIPARAPHHHIESSLRLLPDRGNDVSTDKATLQDSKTTVEAPKETLAPTDDDVTRPQSPEVIEPAESVEFGAPEATCEKMQKRIESVCDLNFEELFGSNNCERGIKLMDRRAFLVYHSEEHAEELELITRWLLMHHVEVSGVHFPGGWTKFQQEIKNEGSGVIIVHAGFEYFTELPGLGDMLCHEVRVWSLGMQEGIEYDPALSLDPPVYRYGAVEIFPVGGLIYITDEVFDREPQVALKIMELFFAKIEKLKQYKGLPSGGRQVETANLLWRLCVRPELMKYLFDYCEKYADRVDSGDVEMQSRARLYTLLAESQYIEQDHPSEPLSRVPDKFPVLSERRIIADSEPVTYFKTVKRDPAAANLNMMRYFAGLHVDLRRDYRHFFLVHTDAQAGVVQQWRDEIQTIGRVMSPRQCVQELEKESRVSMIDFYERFLGE
ncbi:hypothetical protein COCC4DRAFT_193043 [Bipolaris maydis ATCC 48331]|uniref:Chromo domain-containing protein n=2 Tax=Cochliobolus heterostrophus TaxID=5016 RepID=M2TM82_COCH5|nr:uncharacterized protein COCC4DRAFT_193043 [Bipolaris maydis ATCC 48331]EMD87644.1 hypothetical protein COCHEDRAFT_1184918 [Bipolaris maydis C5]ENI06843.1 hypothetical protein COCC4DRAFT_193043 [Bipolaris maydis ATCC 48331]KAJ5023095.1 hypothetical protein J3E73DRAFT_217652 [Bipolaris maydis]KAJ6267112.1 hypothetical protein PSV08DRAFT_209034 [Bipolaris maydis]